MALELAWSGATGWTHGGRGRYLAVMPDQPGIDWTRLREECKAVSPPLPDDMVPDITGTIPQRVLHQLSDGRWLSTSQLVKRLGIESRDRNSAQNLSHALKVMCLRGVLERRKASEAGYHALATFVYRRKVKQ